jgi:hypothetical protein
MVAFVVEGIAVLIGLSALSVVVHLVLAALGSILLFVTIIHVVKIIQGGCS